MNNNQFPNRGGRPQQQPQHMPNMGQQPQQQQQPQQHQHQQHQHQQHQQRLSMLPPQFANMTPQQLQQLRQQPQFQAYLRNYLQRQQQLMAQERQHQNSGGGGGNGTGELVGGPSKANMPPQQQGMMPPPMGQQQLQVPPVVGGGQQKMRMAQGMDGIVPGSNPLQQTSQGMMRPGGSETGPAGYSQQRSGGMGPVSVGGVSSMNSDAGIFPPGVLPNAPNGMRPMSNLGGPGMNPAMVGPKTAASFVQQQHNSRAVPPHMATVGGAHGPPVGPPHMPNSQNQGPPPPVTLPPSIVNAIPEEMRKVKGVNEALSKIPFELMSSTTEWSKKLYDMDEEPSTDLRIYEDTITKDAAFFSKLTGQVNKNRFLIDDMTRDIKNYSAIKQLRVNAINLSSKRQFNNSIWGEGYQGYGNGITNTATSLLLPERDATDREINDAVAMLEHSLVPVRLEFDQERDKFKLRDTFLWDLNEKYLSTEEFVSMLIEDYKFIPKHYFEMIVRSIKEQLNDYYKRPSKCLGELRIPIKLDITINNTQLTDQFEWDILNYGENDPEDFATIMCDEMALPGEFSTAIAHTIREQAQLYHKALHLVGYSFDGSAVQEDEIRNHILPSLRFVAPDSKYVDEFFSVLRNPQSVGDYSPSLVKLTQLEVERLDKEIERDSRRKRRHNIGNLDDSLNSSSVSLNGGFGFNGNNNTGLGSLTSARATLSRRTALHAARGGGHSLPDLIDLPKTYRTPAPSSILPGAVDLGTPDVYSYLETHVIKSHVKNPKYEPPKPKSFSVRVDNLDDALIVRIKLAPERFPGYVRRPSYDSDPDSSSDY